MLSSHLQRDLDGRLRSSTNEHHVVNDNFKSDNKLKYEQQHDDFHQ
jgi:hypothetical protein